jgi:predicted O-methyltransferase YrrM
MDIYDLYRDRCARPSDINEHLPRLVDICVEVDAERIVELGVRTGVSTVAWLYALEATAGHLWSVDITSRPQGFWSNRWTFVQGDDTAPTTLERLPDSTDIVFIDTSHQYEHTLRELEIYSRRVRGGGKIVLHDTEVKQPDGTLDDDYPVRRAIETFCGANDWRWVNDPKNNGLGVIQVPRN